MMQEQCAASCPADCRYRRIGYCRGIYSYQPKPLCCYQQWCRVTVYPNRYSGLCSLVRRHIDQILKLN